MPDDLPCRKRTSGKSQPRREGLMSADDLHAFTKYQVITLLTKCIGKTLEEIDRAGVLKGKARNKGFVGNVIEQSVFGYPADSKQRPDLIVDGVDTELKSTGIVTDKGDYEFQAKEPMSITAVSPETITTEQFSSSHFWKKLEHLLLVYYFYAGRDVPYSEFVIKGFEFHEWDAEDIDILKSDWTLVRNFISRVQEQFEDYESQYPRISSELNRELMYTDTSPKWPNRPRFRLKRRVVTSLVQNHFGIKGEALPDDYSTYSQLDAKCHELTLAHAGKTINELLDVYYASTDNSEAPDESSLLPQRPKTIEKGIAERLVIRMFGGTSKRMDKVELFERIGLMPKSIALTTKGGRTEDMKLMRIDFDELNDPYMKFEDSSFHDYFTQNQLLLILFREPSTKAPLSDNEFVGFTRLWFDEQFIVQEVHRVWRRLRKLVRTNAVKIVISRKKDGTPIINQKSGTIRSAPNFPKAAEGVLFVRGTGADSHDKVECVNGVKMYRQNLWIKGAYLAERIQGLKRL